MPATEGRFRTPVDMLDHWEATRAHEVYLRQPRNGEYHDVTWREAKDQARRIAGALRQLGLPRGERVALLSKNCAEWFIADLAMMLGGYISVPIYPTANAETVRYVLQHSGAKAVFVGKLDAPQNQQAGVASGTLRLALPYDTMPHDYGWEQLLRLAEPLTDYANPDPDRIMTIVYTSGSTGSPKGAVHSFASLGWAGEAVSRHLGITSKDRVVSYLPLAHITERAYIEMASLYSGGSVGFVESTESFIADVKRARPTLFISVPRLWAVFRENILRRVGQRKLDFLMRIPVVRTLAQRRIRAGLGLTHAQTLGCGSAPVSPSPASLVRPNRDGDHGSLGDDGNQRLRHPELPVQPCQDREHRPAGDRLRGRRLGAGRAAVPQSRPDDRVLQPTGKRRSRRLPKKVSSARAIFAGSTARGTCSSPAGRRTTSRRPRASTWFPRRWNGSLCTTEISSSRASSVGDNPNRRHWCRSPTRRGRDRERRSAPP